LTDSVGGINAEAYIRERNLSTAVSLSNSVLSRIHVSVTPTLFAYDAKGEIEAGWTGRLDQVRQAEVESELSPSRHRAP
jgi:hypothetical protein